MYCSVSVRNAETFPYLCGWGNDYNYKIGGIMKIIVKDTGEIVNVRSCICKDGVERWYAHYDTESLKTIADFINAVLEQELSKIRTFDKNEYVYVEGYNGESFEGLVSIDVTVDSEDDKVGIHRLVDGFALTEGEMIKAEFVYQRAKGIRCSRCGGFLYHEHHDKIDNLHYCPNCKGKL